MSSKQQETKAEPQKAEAEASVSVSSVADQPEAVKASDDKATGGSSGEEKGEASRIAALEAELAQVREELSAVNDKYLRKLADDVNFRKRMAREKEDSQRYAVATLLGDLIPVLDDFDRAIASAETQREYSVLHDGVTIIRRQLGSVLETKYGLTKFNALGQAFDPNRHEAVAMVQDDTGAGDEAVVAEEFLPGYGLHDRILRTAKVRVRMPAPKSGADSASGETASDGHAPEAATGAADNHENDKQEN
jgi:molecular chaperone GrpE